MALGMAAACTGDTGPAGKDGTDGKDGSGDPSVSAVTPSHAYLGRTLDLTIAGSGTKWTDATTVAFSDEKIKVNKVTAASDTGLKVNVTIAAAAAVGTADITVTDAGGTETYKGAFDIRSPLAVTTDPTDGVPQGGFGVVNVKMLDIETPYDANDTTVAVTGSAQAGDPSVLGDYAMGFSVLADVLAAPGDADLVVTSGGLDSPLVKAYKVVARAPQAVTPGTQISGKIQTENDTGLAQFTPAAAATRFVQFSVSSPDGQVMGILLPKSGKFNDYVAQFGSYLGLKVSSTDTYYVVVADSQTIFGYGPVPANYMLNVLEVPVTAVNETAETTAANNDDQAGAQVLATLPALVSGDLGYGSVDAQDDVDTYAITVTGATAAAPKTIHAATGGDTGTDAVIEIFDSTGKSLGKSKDLDIQEDLVVSGIKTDGTYYVVVTPTDPSYFDPSHTSYDLFVQVK
jgi:hypothetical protein